MALHNQEIELGLERVRVVAEKLRLLDPLHLTITIAGTNGKGSSAALLEQVLLAAGYSTGVYTSPHLLRYNERLRINGSEVTDSDLCKAFAQVEAARDGVALTFFEFGTLAMLHIIQSKQIDIAILEVGLGGRLDAVNVVDTDLALITNIGLDHQDWLGDSREQIAVEKSGIMRSQRPVVCNDLAPPAAIATEAIRKKASLYTLGQQYHYSVTGSDWCWQGMGCNYSKLPLPGRMSSTQVHNAAGVLASLHLLGDRWPWSRQDFETGLARWYLPGRREKRVLGNSILLLDVAHNTEAAQLLAGDINEYRRLSGGASRTRCLFGALRDKPVADMLACMSGEIDYWYLAGLESVSRGLVSTDLQALADRAEINAGIFKSVEQGWQQLCDDLAEGDLAVVFGSFHTVEAVLRVLDNSE